jgi:hypothetical protein
MEEEDRSNKKRRKERRGRATREATRKRRVFL